VGLTIAASGVNEGKTVEGVTCLSAAGMSRLQL
jgi:hypothetical protein